jgi:hypothetical protein
MYNNEKKRETEQEQLIDEKFKNEEEVIKVVQREQHLQSE